MNTWDEKNSTEPKKNCLNSKENEVNGIIKNAEIQFEKEGCNNIGWERNCPMCNNTVVHKTKYIRNSSQKRKIKCVKCDHIEKRRCSNLIRNCPRCRKVLVYGRTGQRNEAEKKDLLCTSCVKIKPAPNLIRNCPQCNNAIFYKDTSKKNRASRENRVCRDCQTKKFISTMVDKIEKSQSKKRSFFPNYNIDACKYFDNLNKINNWNGRYATNGGELNVLSYFVDYYEPIQNIVIEWDEPHHRRKIGKSKDVIRQKLIKEHLKCKFLRYDVLTKTLNEV